MAPAKRRIDRSLAGSGAEWLAAHHRAKQLERQDFCRRLAALQPKSVLDIGCATGLWLEELDAVLPVSVPFTGVDVDADSLDIARERSTTWDRQVDFRLQDAETAAMAAQPSDLALLFNVSSSLPDLDAVLGPLAARGTTVAVRQFDGATLRFGPMPDAERAAIDASVRASTSQYADYRHFDVDRLAAAIGSAGFRDAQIEFELFQRVAPFPPTFMDYLEGTLEWTAQHVDASLRAILTRWRTDLSSTAYFTELDLVAILT